MHTALNTGWAGGQTLRYMHHSAQRLGLGERIALVPQLDDPKNLFGSRGCLQRRRQRADVHLVNASAFELEHLEAPARAVHVFALRQ